MDGDGLVERSSALWSHLRDVGVRSQRGIINWVSSSVVDVLGYSPEDLVGCTAADITHPDDLAGAMRTRALLVELGASQLRARVRHKDGSYRWMDIRARTEPDDQGEDVMLSSWRDVTDEVAALEAVARNRDELRLVAEHASDVVVRGSDEGRIEWVSPSVRLALGYDPARLVGVLFVSLVHEDDRPVVLAAQDRLRAAERVAFEARIATALGGWRWFAVRVEPVFYADGDRWRVASWRDIDAEVRARGAGVGAGTGLEATLHALADPHVVLAPVRDDAGAVTDFVVADVNEAAAAYIRRRRSELVGARLLDVLPRQATSGLLDRYRAVLETGVPFRLEGFEYDHEVRGRRRFDVSAVRVDDLIAYTFRDVTDRVEAAERTAALEQHYRAIAENVPDIVLRVRDGTFEYVSPSVTPSLGWRPQDLVGKLTYDVIHPDDFALVLRQRANLALLDGPVRFRMRVRDADGTYRWVEAHGDMRVGVDAEPGVYTGTWRLIDDQVAAEADVRGRDRLDP